MAITFTATQKKVWALGDRKAAIVDLTTSGTVSSGGDVLSATTLGMDLELDFVHIKPGNGATSLVPSYDYANSKVRFYTAHGTPGVTVNLIEAVGATPVGTFRAFVIGKGTAAA